MKNDAQIAELKVPRYTSYPTAPHFHEGVGAAEYGKWLEAIEDGAEASIYLHIPFCKKLCWFCGCHMAVVNSYDPITKYVELLKQEISLVAKRVRSLKVKHIHFGGGSPTILKPDDFLGVMKLLGNSFNILDDAEIAVEIDPRTLSEATIAAYAKAGVTRVSIGVQDFNENVQKAVNRIQPFGTVFRVKQMLNDYGITKINMDLMFGLPHQTVASLLETIDLTLTLNPDRIALFGYAHVPWMKKNQQIIDETALPDTATRAEMIDMAKNHLQNSGYKSIGIDHFAKDNDELSIAAEKQTLKRNFQGYTTDESKILLGFGVSAIGSLPQGYIQNISSSREYRTSIQNGSLPIKRGIATSKEDELRRAIIESLMCHMYVDLDKMKKQYNLPNIDFSNELESLSPFQDDGLLEINNDIITINEEGRMLLRVIASNFDTYLKPSAQKHASAI
jgi:oxygen-independent coproporphyrinogen-3 oxidase